MTNKKPLFGIQCIGRKDGSIVAGTGTPCGALFHAVDQERQFELHVHAEHANEADLLLSPKGA